MIQANELRIGNLFQCSISGHRIFATVLSVIGEKGVDCKYDCEAYKLIGGYAFIKYEDMQPIQLTAEIIESCGFEKDADGVYLKNNCLYWLDSGRLQIAIGHTPIINAPCKSLHQLQNLYFALTGKELNTNI